MRCNYHRDHGHETNKCHSLKFLVERLIKEGHLRRYIREVEEGSAPTADRTTTDIVAPPVPRPAINYILGGPFDNQYQSKRQQKKLLRAAMVKARVNVVHTSDNQEETKPIDDPISFPLVNLNRVIVPHYDLLVLTLCINDFDVHRVLVDPATLLICCNYPLSTK